MTRRHFIQTAANTIWAMGFGGLFSSHSAAAYPHDVRHLRQIITRAPHRTRMIQWDSPHQLRNVHVEVRQSVQYAPSDVYIPHDTYFTMDGSAQYIYHAEIPVSPDTAAFRIASDGGATAWIPLLPPAAHGSTRALFFSDSQCGESYDVWRDIYHAAWQRHPDADFAALVGDLVDNGESTWHWESFFSAMEGMGAPLSHHIHAPVLGNHEYYGLSWTAVPPERYLNAFSLPESGSAAFHGHYYSFDIGVLHCIVLDTQFLELGARGTQLKQEQLDWLMRNAAAAQAPWRIVLMHKDILAYGEHQAEQGTDSGISDVGRVFMDAFDALGIDLVISGHIHTYRRRQLRSHRTDTNGTLYLLAGPAGNQYFDVPSESYDLAASANPAPSNYLYMEADTNELRITCETADGSIIDTCRLRK